MSSWLGNKEIVFADFEFRAGAGERQRPVCCVAYELRSRRKHRVWESELLKIKQPPYPVGKDSIFVAYYAPAELGCHLALDWPMPENVYDLFTERDIFGHNLAAQAKGGYRCVHFSHADVLRVEEIFLQGQKQFSL